MLKKNNDKLSLIVLFVQYDQQKYNYSFETLHKTISKDNTFNCSYMIIDNSICQNYFEKKTDDITIINGDNSEREFSAWQKGINTIKELNLNYDLILFINEAFLVYNDNYLLKHFKTAVRRCIKYNAVVGIFDKDEKNRSLSVNDYVFTKWLRSNMFFVPKIIMDKFQSLILITKSEYDKIIPLVFPNNISSYKDCFTSDNTINELFKQKIYEWLTIVWHSKIDLNNDTWNIFRIKAKAILNEALISAKIRSLGFDIIWYAPKHVVYFEKMKRKLKILKK
jgi:hypothetical protein